MRKVAAKGDVHSWLSGFNFVTELGLGEYCRRIARDTFVEIAPSYGRDFVIVEYAGITILVYTTDNKFCVLGVEHNPKHHNVIQSRLNQFGPSGWRFVIENGIVYGYKAIGDGNEESFSNIEGKHLNV